MDGGVKRFGAMLALALAGCGGGAGAPVVGVAAPPAPDWRRQATPGDRGRLREWRTAWVEALAEAGRTHDGAAAIAADPELFDPDRALPRPVPPAGDYRCRTVKLGRRGEGGLAYVAYGWFRCRIGAGGPPTAFAKLDGSQRPSGAIYAGTDTRGVLLGALALGDETRAMDYGRDRSRDVAGLVERIGEGRWRIIFPYPAFESKLDIIEMRADA